MKKIYLLLFFISLISISFLKAQSLQITGVVTSSEDGFSLPGVSVFVKGTTIGTATDIDGRYSLNVPQTASTLVFSFIGMESQEVAILGRSVINIKLGSDAMALEEVVVIAYGTAKKGTYTGAVSSVSAQKIESRSIGNIARAIEGQAAGVQVTSGSGQPGSGQEIRIRGYGSINASSAPLYVVDGVPYTLDISNLNPNDIESISVLKDASATALYGNKAANGVIIVTTKKGNKNRSQFQVRVSQGYSTRGLPEYDRVKSEDWVRLNWEAYVNQMHYSQGIPLEDAKLYASGIHPNQGSRAGLFTGGPSGTGLLEFNPFDVARNDLLLGDGSVNQYASLIYSPEDLDWQKALMQTGSRNEYNILYSGGTAKSDYFASLGYLNENGYLIKTDFERLSGRLNVNTQATSWFRTGVNISANVSMSQTARDQSTSSFVNPFFFTRNIGPIYPIYAQTPITGEYILDDNGNKIYDLGNMLNLGLPFRPSGAYSGRHVVAETMFNEGDFRRNVLSSRTFGEIKFLNDFTFTVNASMDVSAYSDKSYDNAIVGDGAPAGRASRTSTQTTSVNFNQLLNYARSFGEHSFEALLGHESYDFTYDYFYGSKQGVVVDGNYELINFTTINSLNSYQRKYRNEGYFTRLNYGFDEKYFVSGSYRLDGSSRFFKEERWGSFWSLGLGWRLDKEYFMQIPQVNMMMFRASYGQVGNDGLTSYYPWQALYRLNRNNANEPGFDQSTLPAYDLTWESNNSFNIGLDFGIFQRFRGNLEWFHRVSDNLLFDVPLPVSSGISSIDKNIGAMYNQGFEMRVAADVFDKTAVKWTVDMNVTTVKNRITKMPFGEDDEIIEGTKKLKEGRSVYDYWLRQWYGVDPADGLSLYYAQNTDVSREDIRLIGTDTLTFLMANAKYAYSGSAIPNLVGGITNIVSYKDFELTVLLTYQLGGKVYDGIYRSLMNYENWGSAMHADLSMAWKQPGDNTDVPRLDPTMTTDNNAISSRWLIDGSYLNLRSVNLTYNVPKDFSKKLNVGNAKLYATAENLFLISKRKGMNIQQSFAGTTSNAYIQSRIVTVGLNVSF
ncbi:MAG: TonB-dependent receptor [Bacteroidales bacterium]|jgi:TonB-linked SusC/RagA family outer membrane protein|nr:TonB-dependent receptor [Bacteroidales bacterium]